MKRINSFIHLALALVVFTACQKEKPVQDAAPVQSTPKPSAQAIAEWQHQKYSMFIHFGLFSLPAGVWKNEKVTKGYSEQIRAHGKITKEEFHALAKSFNPEKWNPDSVASLAKQAGMKSIVITSKHHDGFAMFHTKFSDFNIVDATPYKHDVIKELADACRKQGLKFGVYFSLIDWDFPGASPISETNSDSIPPTHHQFNLNQVEELVTQYGPLSEIWFDMGKPTLQQSQELAAMVRKHQPDCLLSGRLWNDQGDFAVMGDNASPDFRMGTLWQTPASMFDETWGYRSWQVRGDAKEKAKEKLTSLIKVVSAGGNYLLNIGPMGDGGIVPFERDVLLTMGAWFKQNSEGIYNTTASLLPEQTWGVLTSKPGKEYLFLLNGPADGKLILKGLQSKVTKAYRLSDKSKDLSFSQENGEWKIDVGKQKSKALVDVVALEYEGELQYTPSKTVAATPAGSYLLTPDNAISYHSYSGRDYNSTKPTLIKMEWFVEDAPEGKYTLVLQQLPKGEEKVLRIKIDGQESTTTLESYQIQGISEQSRHLMDVALKSKKFITVEISLADQSNPHKNMEMEGLVLRLEKPIK
ncbi:alpha-L-fucosidase [Chryseolinea serpens]|uniref:alpha-L-fucosidase n=1 Tax=Chryseolinea serpens TaxID=947013 RepID=A0A1M5JPH9_9BACT|nr:alpha-L-fucosidase [Chryseolinea serpens]SHG41893.1 alpha-L-fucosidase [Chryseolinea serpens]